MELREHSTFFFFALAMKNELRSFSALDPPACDRVMVVEGKLSLKNEGPRMRYSRECEDLRLKRNQRSIHEKYST